jgi:hypothetical protein
MLIRQNFELFKSEPDAQILERLEAIRERLSEAAAPELALSLNASAHRP